MTITYSIIAVTSLISIYAFNNNDVMRKLIMNPYVVDKNKQYYRMLTSGFIHAHWPHLLMNMISFYFFGGVVEYVFSIVFGGAGGVYFVLFYLLAIVVSDLPSYFKHRKHAHYNSLGASGGVSAIIFASIIFLPLQDICFYFAICMPGFILGTLYLIYTYIQGRRGVGYINHDAHLYGALFGLLFCMVMVPASIPNFIEQIKEWKMF
jgi:membrane associated rhomboid family serine protease